MFQKGLVDPQGLEPWLSGPKPEVLPLHHGSMLLCLGLQMYKKYLFYKYQSCFY
jgi:hypothetical protein